MAMITGTVQDGLIVPCEPLNWPNGTEVELVPHLSDHQETLVGMTEEEQVGSPEAIERWIAEMDAIPTPEISDEELLKMEMRRQEDKEWERAHAEERFQKLLRSMK